MRTCLANGDFGGLFYGTLMLLFITAGLAVIGYAVLVAPVREVPNLIVRRRFMHWLAIAGFFAGGVYQLVAEDGLINHPVNAMIINPFTGLLFGAAVGNVLGRLIGHSLTPALPSPPHRPRR